MQARDDTDTRLTFEAAVIYWRGPSPFFFVPIGGAEAEALRRVAPGVTYGWGMVPVRATIAGGAEFKTALWPKDDGYLLPLRDVVRRKANVTAGDTVAVDMTVQIQR